LELAGIMQPRKIEAPAGAIFFMKTNKKRLTYGATIFVSAVKTRILCLVVL
jgi:hypothetical protein